LLVVAGQDFVWQNAIIIWLALLLPLLVRQVPVQISLRKMNNLRFSWTSYLLLAKPENVFQHRLRPLPSLPLPIYCSLITLTRAAVQSGTLAVP
jgi:hypothetical protein